MPFDDIVKVTIFVKNLADEYGAQIIVANRTDMSPQQEMVEDLMSIIHTYSCRLYGLRRHKTSRDLLGDDDIGGD